MASQNKKRLFQNLALLIVVLGLVAFVMTRKEDAGETHKTLYDTSIGDNAEEVVIHSEGREDVVLKNENDIWKVIKPTEFVADKNKVRHLFTLLSEDADSSYDVAGKDLARYGLEKDRLSVSFNGVKMTFGKLNEVAQKRFILKGDKIYLVEETVSGLMEMGAEAFKPQETPELKSETKPQ